MAKENIQQLFEELKKNATLRTQFASLKEGDWDGIVKIATEAGFHFSKEEVMAEMPEGFFKGKGSKPELGWRKDHQLIDDKIRLSTHTIWATYKGQSLFQDKEKQEFKNFLFEFSDKFGVHVLKGKVEDKFVHLHFQYPLHLAFGQFIEDLRAQSSATLKEKMPELEQKLNKTPLWDSSLELWTEEKDSGHKIHLFKEKFLPEEKAKAHNLSL